MTDSAPAFSEEQLSDRLFQAMIHTLELFGVYLGKRLGLYTTLHAKGPLTPAGLAAAAGIAERYAREQKGAEAVASDGPFDLIVVLEALHDMARPTRALAAFRTALAPTGSVLVADERVGERFVAPGDPVERMMYGWSVVHCLPVAMVEQPSEAIGTAIRPEIVQRCARDAGFARCEVLAIDNPLFRFYRLS